MRRFKFFADGLRFEWVLVALVVLLHAQIPFSHPDVLLNWYSTDDAFYYFKVAQNISEGRGITFDGINLTNGFHPLWMLICVPVFALARFDLILPLRVLVVVLVAFNLGTGLLIFRWVKKWVDPWLAGLAAIFWMLLPRIHSITTQKGIEAGINAFFVVLLLVRVVEFSEHGESKPHWRDLLKLGLLASLALFSRLDNIFVVICAGIWLVFRRNNLGHYLLAFLVAGVISVLSSFFLRVGFGANYLPFLPAAYWMLAVGVIGKLIAFYTAGLFQPPRRYTLAQEGWRLAAAVGISSAAVGLAMSALSWLGLVTMFARSVLLYDAAITLGLAIAIRLVARLLDRSVAEHISPWGMIRAQFAGWLRVGLGYFLPVGLLLGGYLMFNELVFDTPMPVSGQVKHWWGTIPDTVYGKPVDSIPSLLGWGSDAWWLVFAPANGLTGAFTAEDQVAPTWLSALATLGLAAGMAILIASRRERFFRHLSQSAWWALFVGSMIQILYYGGTLYANTRVWYWVNPTLAGLVWWVFLLDNLLERINRQVVWRVLARGGLALAGLALGLSFYLRVSLSYYGTPAAGEGSIYRPEAEQVMALTEPGSRIGMTGGGAVAYFVRDRTVVNLDGLINSYAYFKSLESNTAREFTDQLGLDYVYGNEYIVTSSNPYYNSLKDRLVLLARVTDMSLFRYTAPN